MLHASMEEPVPGRAHAGAAGVRRAVRRPQTRLGLLLVLLLVALVVWLLLVAAPL